MQRRIPVRKAAARFAAGIAAAVLLAGCGASKDSFRSVQIYNLKGTAQIERQESGVINAVENLYLEAKDRVTVAAESMMRLKLDDDKYVSAEENTVFSIQAEGSKEDSRTTISLETGAITNEIQNPLSKDSLYEVQTPNSVMAVRGTIFRVEVTHDKNADIYTKVTTFEGSVSLKLLSADGTYGDEVIVESGKEIVIRSDSKGTEYQGEPAETDYSELPPEVLSQLSGRIDQKADAGKITAEKDSASETSGQELRPGSPNGRKKPGTDIERKKSGDFRKSESTGQNRNAESADPQNPADHRIPEDTSALLSSTDNVTPENPVSTVFPMDPVIPKNPGITDPPRNNSSSENPGDSSSSENPGNNSSSENPGNSSSSENPGNNSSSENPGNNGDSENPGDSSSSENPGNDGGSENPGDSSSSENPGNNGGSENPGDSGSSQPPEDDTSSYTVTFIYQGNVFGTQTVTSGNHAAEPKLSPDVQGGWDFDFSDTINQDLTIYWK